MTVVAAFLCTNGVVVAADSMFTPTIGNLAVGHHKGVKVELLPENQIFAYAGDQGQGARLKFIAEGRHDEILQALRPLITPSGFQKKSLSSSTAPASL